MKRIALINDMSGLGKCSLTAAIPVISVMGIQACPFPTAILSAQTGFQEYICHDFSDEMERYADSWERIGVYFDGIYSGYLADISQIEKVLYFLRKFRKEDTLYLVDPVMGDRGDYYPMFHDEFRKKMKELTSKADVLTPNLTELCLLAEEDYGKLISGCCEEKYLEKIQAICKKLLKESDRQQTIIVTGILRKEDGIEYMGNMAVSEKENYYIEKKYTGKGFSGTGDLFASVICGSLIKGESTQQAIEKAVYFLQDAILEATEEGIDSVQGVMFEKYLSRLL